LKGKAGYKPGKRREKREKEGKEEREKQKERVVYGVVSLLLAGPIVVRGMETCIISRSCSSVEQQAFPVNSDEAPHPATGVGEVK
jgi:hypothetical protein